MRTVILASASPRRAEIMRMSGIPFDIDPGNFQEDMSEKLPPKILAEKLALGKALVVAPRHPNALIIGADTFIVAGEEILGKPHTQERAKEMLDYLSGNTHKVITGYAIIDTHSGTQKVGASVTDVTFRHLSDTEVGAYVATGEPLELAGAYAIQGGAARFITRIDGDYYGVMGLPLATIIEELSKFHVHAEA